MPLKWKIFRVANYVVLLVALSITATGTYFFIGSRHSDSSDVFYFILFAAGGLALVANYSINIYLLERYYPEMELPGRMTMLIAIVLSVSCVTIGFLTLTYLFEFYDMVIATKYTRGFFNRTRIIAMSFGMILLLTYYIFWMQVALRKTIQRNHRQLYSAFLESD